MMGSPKEEIKEASKGLTSEMTKNTCKAEPSTSIILVVELFFDESQPFQHHL